MPNGVLNAHAAHRSVAIDLAALGPRRRHILELLDQFPGLNVDEVAGALKVQRTAAKHHLQFLARLGLVVRRRQGRHVLHFHAVLPELDLVVFCLFRVPSVKGVAEALHDHPAMRRGELAATLGIAPRTVRRALRQLQRHGLVRSQGAGRHAVVQLHPRLHVLLGRQPVPPQEPPAAPKEDIP